MPLAQYNPSLVVLAGRSGSGKSAVLQLLAQQGFPVIDMEGLAQHGGSAFGHLPFAAPEGSMGFLKSLKKKCEDYKYEPLVFTECKGKALGNTALPESFLAKLQNGFIVHFDVPLQARVEHLANAYKQVPVEDFIRAAQKLKGKISNETLAAVTTFFKAHAYTEAIRLLLAYYDNSGSYNYFIDRAHLTLSIATIDPPLMVEKLTTALMEQHPLFLHCG
jgi:tRNA 2-selenouridine synthase